MKQLSHGVSAQPLRSYMRGRRLGRVSRPLGCGGPHTDSRDLSRTAPHLARSSVLSRKVVMITDGLVVGRGGVSQPRTYATGVAWSDDCYLRGSLGTFCAPVVLWRLGYGRTGAMTVGFQRCLSTSLRAVMGTRAPEAKRDVRGAFNGVLTCLYVLLVGTVAPEVWRRMAPFRSSLIKSPPHFQTSLPGN